MIAILKGIDVAREDAAKAEETLGYAKETGQTDALVVKEILWAVLKVGSEGNPQTYELIEKYWKKYPRALQFAVRMIKGKSLSDADIAEKITAFLRRSGEKL